MVKKKRLESEACSNSIPNGAERKSISNLALLASSPPPGAARGQLSCRDVRGEERREKKK